MSIRFAVALVLLLATCGLCAESQSLKIARLLEAKRKQFDFPGLACAVLEPGAPTSFCAVSVRKLGDPTPLSTNDVFHIGSCTKSMTATLAAMLVEQNALHWNTTIAEIFPELRDHMNEQYRMVTLEQLLTHHGGVPGKPPKRAWSRACQRQGTAREQRYEFITAVLQEPPEAPPGSTFIYSNQGYAIAGAMLERVSGTAYEQLITARLFKPLHMDSAGFGPPGTKGKVDQPWGHARKGIRTVPLQQDNPPAIAPAGTVHCSLADLAKYVACHLRGETSGGLLRPDTFRKLHTPPFGGDYALGWICAQRDWAGGTALTHSGSNTMWYVVLWLAPAKDFAVIVATNTGAGDVSRGCDEVAAALIQSRS